MTSIVSKPTVTIVGHVCIDHNTIDGVKYVTWGSPAMYIAAYYMKEFSIQSYIISMYGPDFEKYIGDFLFEPGGLTDQKTLLYENIVENGHRVQLCHNSTSSGLLAVDDTMIATLQDTDILIVAPEIPNYTEGYIESIVRHVPESCFKALLPQGYMRDISNNGSIKKRHFIEASQIISYFDVIIASDEDCDDALSAAKIWTSYKESLRVVITQSAQGATLFYDGKTELVPTEPLPSRELRNPVGAGDMFSAQLTMSLYNNLHPSKAVKYAHQTTGAILMSDPLTQQAKTSITTSLRHKRNADN